MAITFSLENVDFLDLANVPGKYALSCKVAAPDHDIIRFHGPGTTGNLLIFNGRSGAVIHVAGRYIGVLATILSAFKADRETWVGAPITVTDDTNADYATCTLVPGSCIRTADPKPMGDNNGNSFFDFAASFTWDG